MALFKSYAVIYLAIGAAIYEVLFVFYSYDDTETATFDRTVLIVMAAISLVPRPLPLFQCCMLTTAV